jgi:hypothetical protein
MIKLPPKSPIFEPASDAAGNSARTGLFFLYGRGQCHLHLKRRGWSWELREARKFTIFHKLKSEKQNVFWNNIQSQPADQLTNNLLESSFVASVTNTKGPSLTLTSVKIRRTRTLARWPVEQETNCIYRQLRQIMIMKVGERVWRTGSFKNETQICFRRHFYGFSEENDLSRESCQNCRQFQWDYYSWMLKVGTTGAWNQKQPHGLSNKMKVIL